MDLGKQLYDTMNYYLGEKDRRGNVRLSDEYDDLRNAIGKLLDHTFRAGKVSGSKAVCDKIEPLSGGLQDVQKDFLEEVISNRPKHYIGKALEGYLNRNPDKESGSQ